MKSLNVTGKKLFSSSLTGLTVVLIIMWIILTIMKPTFMSFSNIQNILIAASLSGLIAIGESYLIIAGAIDLSCGAVAAFSGVFSALLASMGLDISLIIIITVAMGALFGLLSAIQVNHLNIQPFIATLAVMSLARGFAYIICDGKPVFISLETYTDIGTYRILGITLPIWFLLITYIIFGIILVKTRFGRHVYMVGGNETATRLAGINAKAIKTKLFMISSSLAAFGGIILASRMNTGQPSAGANVDFDAITAAVLGGVAMTGGVGSITGTFVGLLILQSFKNGLLILNVNTFWQDVANGLLLIVALTFDYYRKKRRNQ